MAFDVIIIGGGHNGLVTAAYLARAGRQVLVLERRELVGGCAVTEEIWPGYRVSTAPISPACCRKGSSAIWNWSASATGRHQGSRLSSRRSPTVATCSCGRIARRRSRRSPSSRAHDAEAYPAYEDHLERWRRWSRIAAADDAARFPAAGLGDFIDYLKLAGSCAGSSRKEIVGAGQDLHPERRGFSRRVVRIASIKVTLATDGVIGANGGPRSPGTAYILLHHCMGGVDGHRGLWGFVRGGMGAVSEAIADPRAAQAAPRSGPMHRCEGPGRDGRARGVVLQSGEEIRGAQSSLAISTRGGRSCDWWTSSDLPADFVDGDPAVPDRRHVAQDEPGAERPARVSRAARAPGPQHRATMHICPSIEYVERAWDDAKYGRPSRAPLLEMTIPTMYDPIARAARQAHHGDLPAVRAIHAARRQLGRASRALRRARARRDRGVRAQHPLASSVERQTLTPLDLERRFGITGGNIFHGEMSLDQMFFMRPVAGWARYRTPVPGLYLCGSGAHPGGGVMGAPGYNAAREILKDL